MCAVIYVYIDTEDVYTSNYKEKNMKEYLPFNTHAHAHIDRSI